MGLIGQPEREHRIERTPKPTKEPVSPREPAPAPKEKEKEKV